MDSLKCDFKSFQNSTKKIEKLIETYNETLDNIFKNEMNVSTFWVADSAEAYIKLFLAKKQSLEELKKCYEELITFIKKVENEYQLLEGSY